MSSKARGPSYPSQDINKINRDLKYLFSQMRVVTPNQTVVPFITGTRAASAPTGSNALLNTGGPMLGPLALNPMAISSTIVSGKGHIAVSRTIAFTSNIIVNTAPSSGKLSFIDGDTWDGQILKVHVISGQSLILESDGNIIPFSSGFTILGPAVVNFIFDSTLGPNGNAGGWIQETSGSSSGGGAGTLWSNITIDVTKNMLQFALENLDFITFDVGNTNKIDGTSGTGLTYSVASGEAQLFKIGTTSIAQFLSSPSNRLDMLQHEIVNALDLKFGTTAGAITATIPMLTVNAGSDMLFNIPTASKYKLYVNNVEIWDIDSTQISGPNIVLSNTLTLNNTSADPSTNGVFQRNGVDVKVYSGGAVRNLSDIGAAASGANVFLSNLSNPTAVNVDLLPGLDLNVNFGSSSKRWINGFFEVLKWVAGREIDLKTVADNGIYYNVNTGEVHSFVINVSTIAQLAASAIDLYADTSLHNHLLQEISAIHFHSSGSALEIDTNGAGTVIDILTNGFETHTLSNSVNPGSTPATPNNGILEVNGLGHLTYSGVLVIPGVKTVNNSAALTNGNYIGGFYMDGNNSATARRTYAQILTVSDNVNAGSETGTIHFQTIVNGVITDIAIINKASGVAPPIDGGSSLGSSGVGWSRLHLADMAADPNVNGQFQRNGADVKVFTGGVARNLSGLPTAGAADIFLSNLGTTSINADLNMNQHAIPNCNFISFDTATGGLSRLIDGITGTGITYNVPSAEAHFFKLGNTEFMRIASTSGILLSSFLDLSGNGIQNIGSLLGAGATETIDIGGTSNRFRVGYIKRFSYTKKNSTPNTTDIPDGQWAVFVNPTNGKRSIYLNDGGNLYSVDLT